MGTLYRLDLDGSVSACVDKLTLTNGMAWAGDHKTMYHIDSYARKVFGFDYNIDSGEISKYVIILCNHPSGVKKMDLFL